jgi:hypothetical protein
VAGFEGFNELRTGCKEVDGGIDGRDGISKDVSKKTPDFQMNGGHAPASRSGTDSGGCMGVMVCLDESATMAEDDGPILSKSRLRHHLPDTPTPRL